jgi:protein transport protein SEC31
MPAPGDRSHIPDIAQPIVNTLEAEMSRIKARAPAQFRPQVIDTEKRLNILFDHLNNEDLLKNETVQEMVELAQAVEARDHDRAQHLFTEILTNRAGEGSTWMVSCLFLLLLTFAFNFITLVLTNLF